MLSGDHLRVFLAVAELRHFVKAADSLGIAQSVASKRLQRLEDQLGTRLIDRRNRADVKLTRAGTLFVAEARAAVDRLDQAERVGRNFARGTAGPLRIGYVFSAAMTGLLSRAVGALHARFPELEPQASLMETPEQICAIAEGRIDVGIVRPRPSYPSGIAAEPVHREAMLIALRTTHPLAGEDIIEARTLAGERFIVPQFHEEVGLVDDIRALARSGRFPVPEIVPTSDFITAASLAAAGVGVVLAPASLGRLRLEGLCYRPISDHDAQLDLVLLHREDTPVAALAALRETLGLPPTPAVDLE